jgi:hypothetical protein
MNWVELERRVYEAVKYAFTELLGTHPKEHFYAFALYTDSSAMTICAAANSVQGLDEKLSQEEEEDRTEETIKYYKWASSEWAYESWGREGFKEICMLLRESPERADIEKFRSKIIDVMTAVLLRIKNEGFFKFSGSPRNPVLFVTVTDDDGAEALENQSAKILNGEKEFDEFLARYDSII